MSRKCEQITQVFQVGLTLSHLSRSFRAKLAEANAKITHLYAEVDRMGRDRKSTFQHDKQLEELRNIQVVHTELKPVQSLFNLFWECGKHTTGFRRQKGQASKMLKSGAWALGL